MPIIGIDPAADRLGVAVVSDRGGVIETRVVSNRKPGWSTIGRLSNGGAIPVAIEGAFGWGLALTLFLGDCDVDVIDVAPWQTAQLRDAGPTHRKTDEIDAIWTAQAARLWGHQPVAVPAWQLELATIVTHRQAVIKDQVARASRIQNMLGRFDPAYRDQLGRIRSKRHWEQLATYDNPRYQMTACTIRDIAADGIREWHHQKLLSVAIESMLPEVGQRLQQFQGIGVIGAATILAHTGDVSRFRSEAAFAAFAGVAPADHSSGNRTRHYASRGGNRQLAAVFHTAISSQIRQHGEAHDYIQRRVQQGTPHAIAKTAAARKLCRRTWRTLTKT